jgi:hypothetical protein
MTTEIDGRPMIASYLKRDETPDPVVLAVSIGATDIATAELPDGPPGHVDVDAALAELGYRPVRLWRHTAIAASVEVEPIEE